MILDHALQLKHRRMPRNAIGTLVLAQVIHIREIIQKSREPVALICSESSPLFRNTNGTIMELRLCDVHIADAFQISQKWRKARIKLSKLVQSCEPLVEPVHLISVGSHALRSGRHRPAEQSRKRLSNAFCFWLHRGGTCIALARSIEGSLVLRKPIVGRTAGSSRGRNRDIWLNLLHRRSKSTASPKRLDSSVLASVDPKPKVVEPSSGLPRKAETLLDGWVTD